MTTVAVIGGGVAGLSAAHELVERGFDVTVWERKALLGGKARSVAVPGSGTDGRPDLPGEHGFRFFPHFYRHLPDTMKRIPFPGNRHGVFDNLVAAPRGYYARQGAPGVQVDTSLPRSLSDLELMVHDWLRDVMDLTVADYEVFASRMWQVLTSCKWRRVAEYEQLSWTDFVGADRRSANYAAWFGSAMTHTLLAASGDDASARTVGDVLVQLLIGAFVPGASDDRLLNGPTNEVWIDPWRAYLAGRGVSFNTESPVVALHCDGTQLTGVDVDAGSSTSTITADAYVLAVPVEAAAPLITAEVVAADSSLATVAQLAPHVQWMSGIQLYLTRDVPIVHGHAVFVDSPWGLTAVSQQQFWPDRPLADRGDGAVRGLLSVDLSRWDTPGIIDGAGKGKTARACTFDEIVAEVWGQLKAWLNVDGTTVLTDDLLHRAFLDPDIIAFANGVPATDAEPLLVNDRGTWSLRPEAHTRVPNLFLAADYVRTFTDLASMEGANEAARRATNAILTATRSRHELCAVWDLHEPAWVWPLRVEDGRRWRRGLPWHSERLHPAAGLALRLLTARRGRG